MSVLRRGRLRQALPEPARTRLARETVAQEGLGKGPWGDRRPPKHDSQCVWHERYPAGVPRPGEGVRGSSGLWHACRREGAATSRLSWHSRRCKPAPSASRGASADALLACKPETTGPTTPGRGAEAAAAAAGEQLELAFRQLRREHDLESARGSDLGERAGQHHQGSAGGRRHQRALHSWRHRQDHHRSAEGRFGVEVRPIGSPGLRCGDDGDSSGAGFCSGSRTSSRARSRAS
mmetsp:Transcript_138026/g.385036  ORF Transcript_138026/g.385036 Transcript_138026/m.385036 type:complete len:235 (-) Transcript_138026:2415-3119(-)